MKSPAPASSALWGTAAANGAVYDNFLAGCVLPADATKHGRKERCRCYAFVIAVNGATDSASAMDRMRWVPSLVLESVVQEPSKNGSVDPREQQGRLSARHLRPPRHSCSLQQREAHHSVSPYLAVEVPKPIDDAALGLHEPHPLSGAVGGGLALVADAGASAIADAFELAKRQICAETVEAAPLPCVLLHCHAAISMSCAEGALDDPACGILCVGVAPLVLLKEDEEENLLICCF
ncbi:hypothetical protein cyc_06265 [Cyclospora cayetanensis]|uniref:Uncharacterized protein n=1 Tax=Cyclospora cayetanensis TaxID=88456 RepID=A0A1D3DAZ5_9EIME|nr:hypothetical protein cyc_06265 [Cyclospora cayetanensis]